MLYLTKDTFSDDAKKLECITKECEYIDSIIDMQTTQQSRISNVLEAFKNHLSIESVKNSSTKLQEYFDMFNNNISSLNALKTDISRVDKLSDFDALEIKYQDYISTSLSKVSETSKFIDTISSDFLVFAMPNNSGTNNSEVTSSTPNKSFSIGQIYNEDVKVPENTLLISEKYDNVYLPYTSEEIANIKKEHSSFTVNEILDKYYSRNIKEFKSPIISRFKEAYKLAKKKEHLTTAQASNLGFELCLKSNLHPAIISACNSIDELDSYLDCLDRNKVSEFDCFNIDFDVAPKLYK